MRCKTHRATNCLHSACRAELIRRRSVEDATSSLQSDPQMSAYVATYGDTASQCDTSSSPSSSDSSSGPSDCGGSD